MLESICCCGNESCSGELCCRVGPIYEGSVPKGGYLFIDTYVGLDTERKWHELMIDPAHANELAWWFAWNFLPGFKHIRKAYDYVRGYWVFLRLKDDSFKKKLM